MEFTSFEANAAQSAKALEPPPRPFIGVPPRTASFTGRANELDRLDAILMRDKPAAVTQASVGRVAVQGMGGVGKTSLAIEYAHRFRGLYAGVCWCPSEERTGLLSALASLGVTLGAATAEEADVEKAASFDPSEFLSRRLAFDFAARPSGSTPLHSLRCTFTRLVAWRPPRAGGSLPPTRGGSLRATEVEEQRWATSSDLLRGCGVPGNAVKSTSNLAARSPPCCAFRKSYPDVMVVQPRQDRNGYNNPGPHDCAT
jgi:hypothetical protein